MDEQHDIQDQQPTEQPVEQPQEITFTGSATVPADTQETPSEPSAPASDPAVSDPPDAAQDPAAPADAPSEQPADQPSQDAATDQPDTERVLPPNSGPDEAAPGQPVAPAAEPQQTYVPATGENPAEAPGATKTADSEDNQHGEWQQPIRQVFGGETKTISEPDIAGELSEADPRERADGVSYDKHSTETADGTRINVAHPVRVDGTNRRSDDDALEGQKCEIVDGTYKGRKGVFLKTETYDPQTGYPVQVIVRTSEDQYELLSVPYKSIRPAQTLR